MKTLSTGGWALVSTVLVFVLLGMSWTSSVSARKVQETNYVPAIFAFGDSLVDSGTNNFIIGSQILANYLPYGETFFHKATGRFTNGRHVVDFIASFVGIPFMPPFLQPGAKFDKGANFGSAGSGILSTTNSGEGVVPLGAQIQQMEIVVQQLAKQLGAECASQLISKSLFLVNSGGNDFSAYLGNATLQQTVSPAQYVTSLLSQLEADLLKLYAIGARKFVTFGLGPLGCTPQLLAATGGTNGQCAAAPNQLSLAYNQGLKQAVAALQPKLLGANLLIVDPFQAVFNLVTNGTALGFTEGSKACCGSGPFNGAVRCGPNNTTNLCDDVSKFVFWDILHPTERAYNLFATAVWNGESSVVQPIGIKALARL